MITKVVPQAASRAKRPASGNQPKKRAEQQSAVNENEARLAQDGSGEDVNVKLEQKADAEPVETETSAFSEFTFGAALAEAAAASSLLAVEAEEVDSSGFGQFGEGGGGTILLIGAIALVALGVVVLVGDGGNKNEAPTITAPAAATTAEDTALQIAAPATTDPDGDVVTVTATATNGAVVKNANGSFTFTPTANFSGSAVITYTASDGELSATATQNVTITAVDDVPVAAAAQALAATEDTAKTGTAGITDADGPALTFTVGTQGTKGVVALGAAGAFTYTPNLNATGADTFTIVGTNTGGSATQTVNVTIAAVNDNPNLGADQSFTINKGGTLQGTLVATDVDSTTLTYGVTTQPTNGTLTVSAAGGLVYTPAQTFSGAVTFVVNVSDNATPTSGTDTQTITVTVRDTPPPVSIDNATGTSTISAAGGDIVYEDDVASRTDVVITGFATGDTIVVDHSGNAAFNARNTYAYTTDNVAGGAADDLVITYNTGSVFNRIVLADAAINADGGTNFVFDYETAKASLGFDFIIVA